MNTLIELADAYAYASRQANDRDSHTRAALVQAIEALQQANADLEDRWAEWKDSLNSVMEQRNALQAEVERLKAAPQAPALPPEARDLPQAQVCCGDYANCGRPCTPRGRWQATQAPKPLTDEQIKAIYQKYGTGRADGFADAARAIEKAHGITEAQP